MARDFAKAFYFSKAWKDLRDYIFKKNNGICEQCGEPGKIVHHIIHITESNINNADITLNEDNLMLVCKDCHEKLHNNSKRTTREGFKFNEEGKLVPISPPID